MNTLGLTPHALALRNEIATGEMSRTRHLTIDGCTVEVCRGRDALWIFVRREGAGGYALRAAYAPGLSPQVKASGDKAKGHEFAVSSPQGTFRVTLQVPDSKQSLLRCTVRLTPAEDLRILPGPRDLYLLDAQGDPAGALGTVHAAQRGLNSGLLYLSLAQPRFGSLLYFQNLTALNEYFLTLGTIPDGQVGGHWPEMGYEMPPTGTHPLPKGKEIVISDAFLHWTPEIPQEPRQSSRLFLDLLAKTYRHLDRPVPQYHDWPHRAEETLHDLASAPEATVRYYGNMYLHPYTASEYPDSMVQLTVLLPLREYQAWKDSPLALTDQLRKGVKHFFDPEWNVLRRYLPNVGTDKDPEAVDSWYLYHPLANLGRLAVEGDAEARDMFLKSLPFAIKVARHFRYAWPVQYKIDTLEVITGPRQPGEPGQSDTGGLYAYVMLQAFEMTQDKRYLEEAKKAIHALAQMEFALEYQANICSWGAGACLRLWKITGEEFYRDQSYVFLASFFHNCLLWESEIGHAKHYSIFLGATCLHDGPYMALYECFETFCAFHEYLNGGGDELPDSVQLLLTEYCKYALSRAWSYYPKELPVAALATEVRNGHIDRKLAFPLEDLYADGQPAGQVGQEIYGCGAAFAFSTRAFHRFAHAPFLLFCDYPVYGLEEREDARITFRVRGGSGQSCSARLISAGRHPLPAITVTDGCGGETPSCMTEEGHCAFTVPTDCLTELCWQP